MKQKLNSSCSPLFQMKARLSVKYFVDDYLRKPLFTSNSTLTPLNLVSLRILVTLRPFTKFYKKLEKLSHKIELKFALLGNCFSDLFTVVKIWY